MKTTSKNRIKHANPRSNPSKIRGKYRFIFFCLSRMQPAGYDPNRMALAVLIDLISSDAMDRIGDFPRRYMIAPVGFRYK